MNVLNMLSPCKGTVQSDAKIVAAMFWSKEGRTSTNHGLEKKWLLWRYVRYGDLTFFLVDRNSPVVAGGLHDSLKSWLMAGEAVSGSIPSN